MIVIVETNFILEFVIQQEHAPACQRLIDLCEPSGPNVLALPSPSIVEAMIKIERERGQRRKFVEGELREHLRELSRAKPFSSLARMLGEIKTELANSENEQAGRLLEFVADAVPGMKLIELTSEALEYGLALHLQGLFERTPDAVIFACISGYLEELTKMDAARDSCFVTRDRRDFDIETHVSHLRALGCRYLSSYEDAVRVLEHTA